jgi:hypothetical protein
VDEDIVCEVVSVLNGWMMLWARHMIPDLVHLLAHGLVWLAVNLVVKSYG